VLASGQRLVLAQRFSVDVFPEHLSMAVRTKRNKIGKLVSATFLLRHNVVDVYTCVGLADQASMPRLNQHSALQVQRYVWTTGHGFTSARCRRRLPIVDGLDVQCHLTTMRISCGPSGTRPHKPTLP
jgi:hypothetical protein